MPKYSVRDGYRTLEFDGVLLAESTSWSADKPRWVEFELFRTPKKQYVLSRVGDSSYYHNSTCYTVSRNHLSAIPPEQLEPDAVPCPQCRATRMDPEGVFPETPRYMAQVSAEASGVVHSLMQEDENGLKYLTNVARRLLLDASESDVEIRRAFRTEHVE